MGKQEAQSLIDDDIKKNLTNLVERENIQHRVLGCTHYPLVAENIERLFPTLKLIDPAEQMSKTIEEYLSGNGMTNDSSEDGILDIFTTGSTEEYVLKANKVGLSPITSVQFYQDRIVITYPDDPEKNNEMAVLQAATDEWQKKCDHWYQYSYEQHYAQGN